MTLNLPKVLAGFTACAATGYAAWTNVRAATEATPDAALWAGAGAVLVAVALSLTAGALAHGLRSRNATLVLSSLLGAVLFGWLALQSALDVVGNARMNTAAAVGDVVSAKTKAQASYDRASRRLDELAPARPAAEIEAKSRQHTATIGEHDCARWVPTRVRVACDARALDQAELARAVERERLGADMTEASDVLTKLSGQRAHGNASTVLLAEFTGRDAAVIDRLVILMRALGIEFGGSLLSMVAVSFGGAQRRGEASTKRASMALSKRAPREVEEAAERTTPRSDEAPCFKPATDDQPQTQAERGASPASQGASSEGETLVVMEHADERLLTLLHERGGALLSSQRTLGKALGVSPATVHRLLHDLSSAGRIVVEPGKGGSVIRLAA